MAEPATTSTVGVTAVIILLMGPQLGPMLGPIVGDYLLIVCGALAGAMHAVGKVKTASRLAAAWYISKWVATAVILTTAVCAGIEQWLKFPATQWPGVIAFGITFLADRWPEWLRRFIERRAGVGADVERTS